MKAKKEKSYQPELIEDLGWKKVKESNKYKQRIGAIEGLLGWIA